MNDGFIGLYGGTFDPIHLGHLMAASEVRQKIGLDEIRMILSSDPPHRPAPMLSAEERFSLLSLAVNDYPHLYADGCEMERDGPSYMVETLLDYKQRKPACSLVLIIGMEVFNGLMSWYRWEEIIALAHIVVTDRAGFDNRIKDKIKAYVIPFLTKDRLKLKQQTHGKVYVQSVPAVNISATQIRQRIRDHKTVQHLLTSDCWDEIDKYGFYA